MRERVAGRLSPPEAPLGGYDRAIAVAQRLQVAVGAVALAAVWVLLPFRTREQALVTGLLVGVYLPWTVISRRAAVRAYASGRTAGLTMASASLGEQERLAAAHLAAVDELKNEFVSTVSHELRTPLTSIGGFVDTVLLRWDQLADEDKKELLRRAAWNTGELRRLIEQVLTFSSLDAIDLAAEAHPYALRRGIEELVAHMSPALRDCRVSVEIDDGVVVMATDEAITHAIGNLLTNASKFSPAGSLIRVAGRRDGTVARITVVDEGPGVPEAERERIFDRFYRGTTTRGTRGTGIGLAIVKTSVEALGGGVDLRRSDDGGGATFEVTLPLADEGAEASVLLL